MRILEEALRLNREGRCCALATIVESVGSVPRKAGARMLVRDDGSTEGTLGGGCLEAEVVQESALALRDGMPRTVPIELTERRGGLVCGGRVLVFIEPLRPDPRLVVLGAGHVGKALARAARFAGFRVTVVDDREEYLREGELSDTMTRVVPRFGDAFADMRADGDTYVVVATRGHLHDLEALRAALATDARYVGLLGSRRKKALILKRLREDGVTEENAGRVLTPVGLPIGAQTPEEIAISIMAQIIEVRRKGETTGIRDSCCGGEIDENRALEAAAPD